MPIRPHSERNAPDAQVAQLVEHATENRSVAGSIPALGTIEIKIHSTRRLRGLHDVERSRC